MPKERPVEPTREQSYQRRIAELEAQLRQRDEHIAALERQVAQLAEKVAKLSRNSSNSSKPPSSDIVKPPKPPAPPGAGKRRIGGQPGHPQHEREVFPPDQIDRTRTYEMDRCPDCGGKLKRFRDERIIQQVEVIPQPVTITEHRAASYRCTRCGKTHDAPMPATVAKGGLVGPNLTALVAYLKGVCHTSFSTIRKYLRDLMGVAVSRGQLTKVIGKQPPAHLN